LVSVSDDITIRVWDVSPLAWLRTLISERSYERQNIGEATGLPKVQRAALKILGAIEEE